MEHNPSRQRVIGLCLLNVGPCQSDALGPSLTSIPGGPTTGFLDQEFVDRVVIEGAMPGSQKLVARIAPLIE